MNKNTNRINHSNIISTNSMSFGMFALLFFGLFIVGLVTGTIATNVLGNSEKMIHPCYYKNYVFDYTDMIDEVSFFHYVTGNKYLLMCLVSDLNVSAMEWLPVTVSSLPCAL